MGELVISLKENAHARLDSKGLSVEQLLRSHARQQNLVRMKGPAMLRLDFANVQLPSLAVSVKILFVLQSDHASMKGPAIVLQESAHVALGLEDPSVKEL
jgi:hypothetical protein